MTRKPLLAANWKMAQEKFSDAEAFLNYLKKLPSNTFDDIDVVICPSHFHLGGILSSYPYTLIPLYPYINWGSQDLHWEKKGAYTGCISASELADRGVRCTILGHSERRRYFKETSDILGKKLLLCREAKLIPIFCVGESKEDREKGQTFDVLRRQLKESLLVLKGKLEQPSDLVIAYEPVWAIGTGLIATPNQAQEAHAWIRDWLSKNFGKTLSQGIRLLYGGSVTPENFDSVAIQSDVDGALVGGASLKAESFFKLLEILKKAKYATLSSRRD